MNENDVYLAKLSKELKRHSVSTSEMQHTLARVQETLELSGSTPVEEFGTPETYVRALYPDREQQKYYLFTLVGLILGAAGFAMLHVYFHNQGMQETMEALWKFTPLLAIPLGMLVDFTRYLRA